LRIDETLGTLQVAKELNANSMHSDYVLTVKAVDKGKPALSSSLAVHIMVVMADNAPPRYTLFCYRLYLYLLGVICARTVGIGMSTSELGILICEFSSSSRYFRRYRVTFVWVAFTYVGI